MLVVAECLQKILQQALGRHRALRLDPGRDPPGAEAGAVDPGNLARPRAAGPAVCQWTGASVRSRLSRPSQHHSPHSALPAFCALLSLLIEDLSVLASLGPLSNASPPRNLQPLPHVASQLLGSGCVLMFWGRTSARPLQPGRHLDRGQVRDHRPGASSRTFGNLRLPLLVAAGAALGEELWRPLSRAAILGLVPGVLRGLEPRPYISALLVRLG
mmetsp:Transcript_62959/g.132884  ORF Transcript_62959/g.132884 Transcript_62959/m.132884 type:complete len:215 (-) Transcript_62959:365-1009(-)